MGLAKSFEKIRRVRRRLRKGNPMVLVPANPETVDQKMIGTMALEFNSMILVAMVKYFGVHKRATIEYLEKEVGSI